MLDAIETDTGTSAILRIYSGSLPANCAAASTGTLGAEMSLPADYMAAASGGTKAKSGTWSDASANASITAGYARLFKSDGTTCTWQGDVTATGGGGALTLDSTTITATQVVTVTAWTWSAPGA